MDSPIRVPPRFVPTLTTVVDLEAEPAPEPQPQPQLEPQVVAQPHVPQETLTPSAPSAFATAADADAETPGSLVFARLAPASEAHEPVTHEPAAYAPAAPNPAPDPAPYTGGESIDGAAAAFEAVAAPDSPAQVWDRMESPPAAALPAAPAQGFKAISPIHEADAFRLEEELLHRVLQRVDLSLEERLTEVVSATVQQQLDAMVPRLRDQVEAALRQLVVEAMAHELSETPGSGPASGAPSLG